MKAEQTTPPSAPAATDSHEVIQARRSKFVSAYIELRDPRKAALRAGSAPANANRTAKNMLKVPDVRRQLEAAGVELPKTTTAPADGTKQTVPSNTEQAAPKKLTRSRKPTRRTRRRPAAVVKPAAKPTAVAATELQAAAPLAFALEDVVTVDRAGRISLGDLNALPDGVSVVVNQNGVRVSVQRKSA